MGAEILKCSFNWTTLTWIASTWFLPPRKKLKWKVNMIWTNIIDYTKWCCMNHTIHKILQIIWLNKPVIFLQENLWHIILCHWYIHSIQYPYYVPHPNSPTEQVTLHQHQIASYHQQASQLQEIIRHTTTHPNWYCNYQLNLIHPPVNHIRLHWTHCIPGIIKKIWCTHTKYQRKRRVNKPL